MTDHQKVMEKTADVAKALGVAAPTRPTPDQSETYDRLSRLSGAEFDRQFLMQTVLDHRKDIDTFEQEAKSADNPKVADLAKDTLPTLRDHLETARSLQQKLSG